MSPSVSSPSHALFFYLKVCDERMKDVLDSNSFEISEKLRELVEVTEHKDFLSLPKTGGGGGKKKSPNPPFSTSFKFVLKRFFQSVQNLSVWPRYFWGGFFFFVLVNPPARHGFSFSPIPPPQT